MIFFPTRDYLAQPKDFNLMAEDAWMETGDSVRVHGWFFAVRNSSDCVIFFHGNATNISGVLPYAKGWVERGYSVLLLDYRGYGQSEGSIKVGADIFHDARAGVDWLRTKKGFSASRIILYGQSIGSAAAVELATLERYRALILEAPFSSLGEMSKAHYGFALDFFLKDFRYENEASINRVQCPLFIVHGTEDEVSPFWMGRRVFAAAREPKEFMEVPGAHHNDLALIAGDDLFEKPIAFLLTVPLPEVSG